MRKGGTGRIQRRAQSKLEHVASVWAAAVGGQSRIGSDPLACVVTVPNAPEAPELILRYEVRNKLFASLFDLHVLFEVDVCSLEAPKVSAGGGGTSLGGDELYLFKGAFAGNGRFSHAAEMLNCEIALSRLEALSVVSVSTVPGGDGSKCVVDISCLVGSATWNLIPPVFDVVCPTREECVKGIELFRMIAVALQSSEKS